MENNLLLPTTRTIMKVIKNMYPKSPNSPNNVINSTLYSPNYLSEKTRPHEGQLGSNFRNA